MADPAHAVTYKEAKEISYSGNTRGPFQFLKMLLGRKYVFNAQCVDDMREGRSPYSWLYNNNSDHDHLRPFLFLSLQGNGRSMVFE